MTTCLHFLGTLACDNDQPHTGDGKGCTHTAAWLADVHTQEVSDD